MNTTQRIFHQFRADLRCNRVAIAMLWLICVVFAVLDHYPIQSGMTFGFFVLIGGMLAVVTLANTMICDPATGDEAFWMTRPLRGREMAGAKLLMLLVVYVPVATAWFGLPLLEFGRDGGAYYFQDFWKTSTPVLAAVVAAASFSKRMPSFAIIVTGLLALAAMGLALAFSTAPDSIKSGITEPLRESGLMLAIGIFLAGAIVVAALQYLRGYRHLHVAMLAATIVLGSLAYAYVRVDLISNPIGEKEAAQLGLDGLAIQLSGALERDALNHTYGSGPTVRYSTVRSPVAFSGLTAPLSIESLRLEDGSLEGSVSFTDLTTFSTGLFDRNSRASRALVQSAYPDYRILSSQAPVPLGAITLLRIKEADYLPLVGKPFRFEATANCAVAKLEEIGSVPFGERGIIASPALRFEVTSAVDGQQIDLRLDGQMRAHLRSRANPYEDSHYVILVNRRLKEVIYQSGSGGGHSNSRYVQRRNQYSLSRVYGYGLSRDGERERIDITDEWLAESEVVILLKQDLGSVRIPIELDELVMP